MYADASTALRGERRKELQAEAERVRLVRKLSGTRRTLGRRATGQLGGMMIAVGMRLERFGRSGRSVAFDL